MPRKLVSIDSVPKPAQVNQPSPTAALKVQLADPCQFTKWVDELGALEEELAPHKAKIKRIEDLRGLVRGQLRDRQGQNRPDLRQRIYGHDRLGQIEARREPAESLQNSGQAGIYQRVRPAAQGDRTPSGGGPGKPSHLRSARWIAGCE